VTASGPGTTEASAMSERPASGTATFANPSALSIPNKPMVPTAPNPPEERSPDTWRRHIGQSLGHETTGDGQARRGRRTGKTRATDSDQRAVGSRSRAKGDAQRPARRRPLNGTSMDRRTKAILHKDKATHLNEHWGVGAAHARYSDDGHWYAKLERFPAALFDVNGYVLFPTEKDYRNSPHLKIGKQISIRKPGISAIPGYVRVGSSEPNPSLDVDIHFSAAPEGRRRLVVHLQRERNQAVVRRKKKQATSLDCEVCGFSFGRAYGDDAADYCEVHHLLPLSDADDTTKTRMADLAILCANCHRVVHLRNPPYTLDQVRGLIAKP